MRRPRWWIISCSPESCLLPFEAAPVQISESDLGYLNGIYSMSADGNLRMQQDGIAYRMRDTPGK